uniref:PLDA1 n=1 Tax=Arundo donax TaxID=35708 RepID=A0A0A9FTU5_ARUDO
MARRLTSGLKSVMIIASPLATARSMSSFSTLMSPRTGTGREVSGAQSILVFHTPFSRRDKDARLLCTRMLMSRTTSFPRSLLLMARTMNPIGAGRISLMP